MLLNDTTRKKGGFPFYLYVVIILLFLFIDGPFIKSDFLRYRALSSIQKHGQRVIADVDSIYIHGCPRGRSCVLNVKYHFEAASRDYKRIIRFNGDDYLGLDTVDDNRRRYVSSTGHVPIAYDIINPNVSAINFYDDVFKINSAKHMASQFRSLGITILIGLTVIFGTFFANRLQQRRLT